MLQTILEIVAPVLAVCMTILTPIIAAAVYKLLQKWGIEIDATHREALQSALRNAAILAVSKASVSYSGAPFTAASVPISIAIDYMTKSVPGALDKFNLSTQQVTELLAPHIAQAITEKVAATTTTP